MQANAIGLASSHTHAQKSLQDENLTATNRNDSDLSRQLQVRLTIDFVVPQSTHQGCLDDWIYSLEQTVPSPTWRDSARHDNASVPVEYWINSCLKLSQSILWTLRIPAFDPFRVMTCEARPTNEHTWRATVRLPCPDVAFYSVVIQTINRVMPLAVWASQTTANAANKQRFYRTIQDQVLTPYGATMSLGSSTLEILRVAYRRSIPFLSLGKGVYQLGWGANAKTIDRSSTPGDSARSPRITANKSTTTKALSMAGLPSPINRAVKDKASALKCAQTLGWPVVVKPVDGERGEGVSVDVDETQLSVAFERAHSNSRSQTVLVEKQVDGICYRLFIAGERLLYAVKRLPIGVYGDGKCSVEELVNHAYETEKGRPHWKRSPIQPLDAVAHKVLQGNNLSGSSIPDDGQFVPLRPIETTASGGVDIDVTHHVHSDNVKAAVLAAQVMGLEVAGVDLITTDVSRPWYETGAIINEVNYAPLLGGGEISRSYIPTYLERLLDGDGRIPVEIYVGGDSALSAARERGAKLATELPGLVITTATHTESVDGQTIPMPLNGLGRRVQALTMRQSVEALIIVVQDDEVLRQGLTLDVFDQIVHVDDQLRSREEDQRLLSTKQVNALLNSLCERKK